MRSHNRVFLEGLYNTGNNDVEMSLLRNENHIAVAVLLLSWAFILKNKPKPKLPKIIVTLLGFYFEKRASPGAHSKVTVTE